jgi:hypothetical protein
MARIGVALRITSGAALLAIVGAVIMADEGQTFRAPSAPESRRVQVATTGNDSELVTTLPITTDRGAARQVVMSLPPSALPALALRDTLSLAAELQVTDNCGVPSPRCVGPIYHYAPRIRARLILAPDPRSTGGPGTVALTGYQRHTCTPVDREHHCVLVLHRSGPVTAAPGRLPCPPHGCYVNLVADAHSRAAGPGEVVMVGGDRPDGSIPQDRGRINAILYRGVSPSRFPSTSARTPLIRRIPPDMNPTTVFSRPLSGLQAGEQVAVRASMRTDVTHVPYNVRTSARLIVADSPTATTPSRFVRSVTSLGGEVSENNGFNCTQAKGSCLTRKVGVFEVRRNPVTGTGALPLYVNLVTVLGPKVLVAHPTDRVWVTGGGITATPFPPRPSGGSG